MAAHPGHPDVVQVNITLDIPIETLLSPRGDLCASSDRELREIQTIIESARREDLPSAREELEELVRNVLEVRDAVHYHQLAEVARGQVTWRVERPGQVST